MESIKKFPRGILNQVISKAGSAYGGPQRAPDSGLKLKQQASSSKEPQASGSKLQAPSTLEQASSHKRQAP
jgi:hypothetical protein